MILMNGDHAALVGHCAPYIRDIDTEFHEKLMVMEALPPPELLTEQNYTSLCGPQPIVKPWFPEGIKGLPSDAMYTAIAAVYILKHCKNTFDGFKEAIRLGGDVDSIAAIVTGILAGKYGLATLPKYMLERVEGSIMLENLAEAYELKRGNESTF